MKSRLPPNITAVNALLDHRKDFDESFLYDNPKDRVRGNFAFILGGLAVKFLIDHEITHLLHGHVYYVNRLMGLHFIEEIPVNESNNIDPMISQGLELDADNQAIALGLHYVLKAASNYKKQPEEFQYFFETQDRAVLNWAFAIYCLFRLFWSYTSEAELKMKSKLTHPPDVLRQVFVFDRIVRFVPQIGYNTLSENRIVGILEWAYHLSEDAFAKISGINPAVILIEKLDIAQEGIYIKEIMDNFRLHTLPELNSKYAVIKIDGYNKNKL